MFETKVNVEELLEFPRQSVGAPMPLVLADEQHVLLSYLLQEQTGFALVQFHGVGWHSMGGPNDETLHGHPLYSKGLRHYSVFETKPSPQIERLRKIASVHRMYNEANFKNLRHLMFTFHDSLFECVTDDFTITVLTGQTYAERLSHMQDILLR